MTENYSPNKQNDQIKVFHGTTSYQAAYILIDGFKAETHVTTSEDLAWYYAEAALDEDCDEDNDEVVLYTYVSIDMLDADTSAMAEPVGWGGKKGIEIEEKLKIKKDYITLETSLQLCASAKLKTDIAANKIYQV